MCDALAYVEQLKHNDEVKALLFPFGCLPSGGGGVVSRVMKSGFMRDSNY